MSLVKPGDGSRSMSERSSPRSTRMTPSSHAAARVRAVSLTATQMTGTPRSRTLTFSARSASCQRPSWPASVPRHATPAGVRAATTTGPGMGITGPAPNRARPRPSMTSPAAESPTSQRSLGPGPRDQSAKVSRCRNRPRSRAAAPVLIRSISAAPRRLRHVRTSRSAWGSGERSTASIARSKARTGSRVLSASRLSFRARSLRCTSLHRSCSS
jgi:hypothetical protein